MTNPGLGTSTSSPGFTTLMVISSNADEPLGVIMMLDPLMSPYFLNLSATACLSSGMPAVGPYLLRPADDALFIPSIASLGGARSGSPRPRLMESGPARSNIFLIPDMGMSFILLETCMRHVKTSFIIRRSWDLFRHHNVRRA